LLACCFNAAELVGKRKTLAVFRGSLLPPFP
jgi:hypothetical protein